MRYAFTPGAHIKGDAQAIGESLETLQTEHRGELTPRHVLDAGRLPESPLHPCFEWDDVRAAELFREEQAGRVLRSIRVIHETPTGQQLQRVFVNVVTDVGGEDEHRYVPVARVLSDDALFQQVCEQAARDLSAFENRYAQFESLSAVGRQARASVEQLKARA